MTRDAACPFCNLDREPVWSSELVVAFRDAYPVSPGHTLVVPRRHVLTYFDASPWEQQAIWQAVAAVKAELDGAERKPDGYNVGFNALEAAGQTVMHCHVHVIPRYAGDVPDPRGGVRGVIPSKQKYSRGSGLQDPATAVAATTNPFDGIARFVPGEKAHLLDSLRAATSVADEIDVVAAFIQRTGLARLDLPHLLGQQKTVRVLTGDYLLQTDPAALQELFTLSTKHPNLAARLYTVSGSESFHPKAYIFGKSPHGIAFVGSSNLSRTALAHGIEWNLRTSSDDSDVFAQIRARFDHLFARAQPLTRAVVDDYQARRPPNRPPLPGPEALPERPVPHAIQEQVLAALRDTREAGHQRGLVVMATGLGKTFLSAFDFEQTTGKRALFVAHREEILQQAASTWSRLFPDRSIGMLTGRGKEPDADLLFASVQTLSRVRHLRRFDPEHFDYIVIDEFHHAAAASYRKLLNHFEPAFLLGLTATPDRMDGAALLQLCDHNLVARVGLIEGIGRGFLVPFRYFGIRDSVDYQPIPWRGRSFDTDALTQHVSTQARAAQALAAYRDHATQQQRRALVFCCSVSHADFMADYLRSHGVPAAAVHSGATSASRAGSLDSLRAGKLEAICAVDIFNEGVDLPDVNTILMLRPTESPIIFLQQLGRGLRHGKQTQKDALTVVDFIGNHRSFLSKPQALVTLTGRDVSPGGALSLIQSGQLQLPDGCSVEIEPEAIDMLSELARLTKDDHLRHVYFQLRGSLGRRPTAAEVHAAGVTTATIKRRYGTWLDFLDDLGDLEPAEKAVLNDHRDWFVDISKTQLTRSYKMVTLDAMLEAQLLHDRIGIRELVEDCLDRLESHPVLARELDEYRTQGASLDDLERRWRRMPLGVLEQAKGMSRRWFRVDGDDFVSCLQVPEPDQALFDQLTWEIVELRLAEHITKRMHVDNVLPLNAPIGLVLGSRRGSPYIRLDRTTRPDTPEGRVSVHAEGADYRLNFGQLRASTATAPPDTRNVLPTLLRRWFGPTAGQPGTRHIVELVRHHDGSLLRPRRAQQDPAIVVPLGGLPYYDQLQVACGVANSQHGEGHDSSRQLVVATERKLDPKRHFIVRASGDSMDGGQLPISDGDLVLCEWATVSDPQQVEGRPVLLTGGTADELLSYLKIPVRRDGRWVLRSSNPQHRDISLDPGVALSVVAYAHEVVAEEKGLVLWARYDRNTIAPLFGSQNSPNWRTGHKDIDVEGRPHTVLMVNLRKPKDTPLEHRYADRFITPSEFQWESQSRTAVQSTMGQRVLGHAAQGRTIHLFVRYHTKNADGRAEPFVYCGPVRTLRHEGEKPIRVWFELETPLPEGLFRAWSRVGQL